MEALILRESGPYALKLLGAGLTPEDLQSMADGVGREIALHWTFTDWKTVSESPKDAKPRRLFIGAIHDPQFEEGKLLGKVRDGIKSMLGEGYGADHVTAMLTWILQASQHCPGLLSPQLRVAWKNEYGAAIEIPGAENPTDDPTLVERWSTGVVAPVASV